MDDQEKRHLMAEHLGNLIGIAQLQNQRKSRESLEKLQKSQNNQQKSLERQLKLLEEQQQAASRENARLQSLPKCCYCKKPNEDGASRCAHCRSAISYIPKHYEGKNAFFVPPADASRALAEVQKLAAEHRELLKKRNEERKKAQQKMNEGVVEEILKLRGKLNPFVQPMRIISYATIKNGGVLEGYDNAKNQNESIKREVEEKRLLPGCLGVIGWIVCAFFSFVFAVATFWNWFVFNRFNLKHFVGELIYVAPFLVPAIAAVIYRSYMKKRLRATLAAGQKLEALAWQELQQFKRQVELVTAQYQVKDLAAFMLDVEKRIDQISKNASLSTEAFAGGVNLSNCQLFGKNSYGLVDYSVPMKAIGIDLDLNADLDLLLHAPEGGAGGITEESLPNSDLKPAQIGTKGSLQQEIVSEFWLRRGENMRGPVSREELADALEKSQLNPTDLIAIGESGPWKPLSDGAKHYGFEKEYEFTDLRFRAESLRMKGLLKDAIPVYMRAVIIKPTSMAEWRNLGWCLKRVGRLSAAIEALTDGLAACGEKKELVYNLACYHSLAGNTTAAVDLLAKAISLDEGCRQMASKDSDFDSIREFIELL